jgi:hypothetical protein
VKKLDREALKLAMAVALKDPFRKMQIEAKLELEPWVTVAKFASEVAQERALHLQPWEDAPCIADFYNDDCPKTPAAVALLKRMLACGVSRWHPNPLAACEMAERSFKNAKA